jgi:hypothetical protein
MTDMRFHSEDTNQIETGFVDIASGSIEGENLYGKRELFDQVFKNLQLLEQQMGALNRTLKSPSDDVLSVKHLY